LSRDFAFHVAPLLYHDGRNVRLLWGNDFAPQRASARTFAVNDDATYGDERPVVQADGEAAPADKIVGRGETTLYHRFLHQVWAARTATAVLERYAADPESVSDPCGLGTYTQILEMHTPTTGLIAMVGGPVSKFDLDARSFFTERYGPEGTTHVCRSTHVVFESGDEILAWQPPRDDMIEILEGDVVWRRTPQDPWQSLEHPVPPVASCGLRYKDLAFLCVSDRRHLAVYQRDARRPELRPRYCGELEVSPDVTHGAETEAGVLIGGELGLMWLVPSE
jgi:hypothetical protein